MARTSSVATALLRNAAEVIVALAVIALLLAGFARYKARAANAFCADVPASTPQSVLTMARDRRLRAFDHTADGGTVMVTSQDSPFFRFACEIRFEKDKSETHPRRRRRLKGGRPTWRFRVRALEASASRRSGSAPPPSRRARCARSPSAA